MTEINIEKTILGADPKHTKHLLKNLIDKSTCPICQDHMFVPFMTKCGHDFCYECLCSWLANNLTCPTCRAPIDDIPYYNVFAQHMLESVMEIVGRVQSDEGDEVFEKQENNSKDIYAILPEYIKRDRDLKIKQYKKDLKSDNLFKKIFDSKRTAIIDSSDGVARCSNCQWEVEGNRCPNCHLTLINPYYDSQEDEDYDQEFDDVIGVRMVHSENDSPDSDDEEFIDDRELDELERESEGDLLSSGPSSPVRRNQYFPTNLDDDAWEDRLYSSDDEVVEEEEDWNGFDDRIRDHITEVETELAQSHCISESDSSDSDSSNFNVNRRRGRNTIMISDDE